MSRFWILAANHAGARIFATEKRAGPLEEVDSIDHPDGRKKETEFGDKEIGTAQAGTGQGRTNVVEEQHHKRNDEERFARELSEYLKNACQQNAFQELYVLSEPRFLGALRASMPEKVRKMLKDTIDKDVTRQPPEKVRKQLPEWL